MKRKKKMIERYFWIKSDGTIVEIDHDKYDYYTYTTGKRKTFRRIGDTVDITMNHLSLAVKIKLLKDMLSVLGENHDGKH